MQRGFRYLALTAIATAIFIVAVLPFLRSWDFGIINLDDYWYVAIHDEITAGIGWEGIRFGFTCLEEGIWMPLTWLSYMLDHSLFGRDWGWFHIHSITIHGINAVLVFLLMQSVWHHLDGGNSKRISGFFISAFVAMFWAAHPLRCESVVFIASRKDVVSLMWMLLAMLAWLKHGDSCTLANAWKPKWYVISMLCFAMAAMSKPSVMTFPLLCFLLDYFIVRKVRPVDYLFPLAIAGFLGWLAGYAQAAGGATENVTGAPFWYKIVNAATSFGLYLKNTVCPTDLAPQCVIKYPEWPRFCVPGILICVTVGCWMAHQGLRYWNSFKEDVKIKWRGVIPVWDIEAQQSPIFAGGMWFVLSVAPMLGIAGFGYHSMADRFTYIPAIGICIIILGILKSFAERPHGRLAEFLLCGIVVGIVTMLCLMTVRQTGFWENDHTLFSRTVEVDGDRSAPAHGILANWYFEFPHDLEKCVEHFEKVKAVNLRYVEMSFQIYIFALCELGREDEVPELLKMYDGWIRRESEENPRFGKYSIRSKMMRTVYFFSRMAYLITQPDLRKAAKEDLENVECPKNEPYLLYLKWRLALAEGDAQKAESAKREMLENSMPKGYTRFRYLRGLNGDASKEEGI